MLPIYRLSPDEPCFASRFAFEPILPLSLIYLRLAVALAGTIAPN
jgi:hypothetical protein